MGLAGGPDGALFKALIGHIPVVAFMAMSRCRRASKRATAAGGGGVQGADFRGGHGDGRHQVALLPHPGAQPLVFAADDQGQGWRQVGVINSLGGIGGRADDRQAGVFQPCQAVGQVGHPVDRQVFQGPGRGLDHHGGHPGGPVLGDDEAVGPGGVGAAAEVPQVHGVGEAVRGHQEGRPGERGQIVQEFAQAPVNVAAPAGGNPLVVRGFAEAVQDGPLGEPEAHPGGPGQPLNLREPVTPRPLGHDDLFQGGVGLAQRGHDRVASVDDLGHGVVALSFQRSAVSQNKGQADGGRMEGAHRAPFSPEDSRGRLSHTFMLYGRLWVRGCPAPALAAFLSICGYTFPKLRV